MLGVVPLAAALAITAGAFDVIGTVSTETRGGETPIIANQAPQPTVMAIAIPGAQLVFLAPRLTLLATYHLRIFWRSSEEDPMPAPLYLHALALSLTARPSQRLSVTLMGTAFEGAADYTFLPVIYGSSQATLLTVPSIFSTSGSAGAELRATRALTTALMMLGTHNQPVGQAVATTGTPGGTTTSTLPHFTSVTVEPMLKLRLSRTAEAALLTPVTYEQVAGPRRDNTGYLGPSTGTLSVGIAVPALGLTLRLTHQTELKMRLGAAFTHFMTEVPGQQNSVSPDGEVQVDVSAFHLRSAALHLLGITAVHYYLDPVLAIAAPRGNVGASAVLRLPGDWSVGTDGAFASSFAAHAPPGTLNPTYPDEVTASATLWVRHSVSQHWSTEVGGRWSDRSPFFEAPGFGFHQRQLWAYVMVTGTTRASRVPIGVVTR